MNAYLRRVGLLLALFIVGSCSDNMVENSENSSLIEKNDGEVDLNSLKSEFSFALARVLNESEGVRKLIKEEAIKQFDYDYDVLYMLVKDKQLGGGGTLEGFLLKYVSRENLLSLYKEMPTLTIFVPSLPGDSFSAEGWNTAKEIPYVAYKNKENEILFVDNAGNLDIINRDEIPIFPIVVVKPSERVILQSTSTRSSNNSCIMRANNGINFVFEYDEFNNITPSKANTRAVEIPDNLKRIYDAKKYADQNGVWQRDYIYYDISTMEGMGMYRNNISECIYAFELTGDPNEVYGDISDQDDDPHYEPFNGYRGQGGWYGGNYEFIVKTYVSSSQLVANEIIKVLSISPKDLFWYNGEKRRDETQIKTIGAMAAFKKYYLPIPIPLFDWNLENYSSSITISIEEKDIETTEQNVTKTTSTFATNFEFNPTFAAVVKIGAKMGASATVTHEVSTTITRYLNSDVLGDVLINFGDDVVIKNEMENIGGSEDESLIRRRGDDKVPYTPKPIYVPVLNPKYNSGRYKIEIIPLAQY